MLASSPSATPADVAFFLRGKGFDFAVAVSPLGKDKLAVLLRRQRMPVSTFMVGRILTRLKQHGHRRSA